MSAAGMTDKEQAAGVKKAANAALAEWRTRIERLRAEIEGVGLAPGEAAAERIGRLNERMARIEQELCALDGQSGDSLQTTRTRIGESFAELERRFGELERMLSD